jgi:hypothetical protein
MTTTTVSPIQFFDIRSDGSIHDWLRLIIADGAVSHYFTGERPAEKGPNLFVGRLELLDGMPTPPDRRADPIFGAMRLLGSIQRRVASGSQWFGPDVEAVGYNITAWLNQVDYPDRPTGGRFAKGWRISNDGCSGNTKFFVEPHWQPCK